MAKASEITEEVTLRYASHEFKPVDMLDFIQLEGFKRGWRRAKLTDEDAQVLRTMIAAAPAMPPVVKGTGGLRKIRFKDPKSNRGKSAGYRICYAYLEPYRIVLLMQIYRKSRKDNLTTAECNAIKEELEQLERSLKANPLR
jgi:mRNA-degrading endonuclease RelE of RelBE toxin-antitoxin system